MERWESLQTGSCGIYQDPELGLFTEDPVHLVHFMRLGARDTAMDLGTGNGIIPLYANALYGTAFSGLDTDGAQLMLARRSAERNGQALSFYEADVSGVRRLFTPGSFSAVTCNPPYYTAGTGSENAHRNAQRHTESLAPFFDAAFFLLNNGGRLYLCCKSEQLTDVMCLLRAYRLEPKRLELRVKGGQAKLALLECKKLAGPGVRITVTEY